MTGFLVRLDLQCQMKYLNLLIFESFGYLYAIMSIEHLDFVDDTVRCILVASFVILNLNITCPG